MESTTEAVAEGVESGVAPEQAARAPINQTIYNGTQPCGGCGTLMSPLVVLFGTGLCPVCQNKAHRAHIERRMA